MKASKAPAGAPTDARTSHRRRRGFTLVELVVVIAIFSLVGLLVAELFVGHNNLYRYYTSDIASGSSAALALDRMVTTIRQAESIASAHTISGTTYTTGPAVLVLQLETVNSTNDFVAGSYDYVVWYRDASLPQNLVEIMDAAAGSRRQSSTRLLSGDLAALAFSYNNNNLSLADQVTIGITTQDSFQNSSTTKQLTAQVKLRNKS